MPDMRELGREMIKRIMIIFIIRIIMKFSSSGSSWKFHHQDHHDNATKESYWTMLVGWTMRRWWRTFCGRQTNQAAALSRFSFCEISSDICKILWISRTAWCWKTAGNSWDTPSIAHQGPNNQKSWNVLDAIIDPFFTQLWHRGGLSHLPEDIEV